MITNLLKNTRRNTALLINSNRLHYSLCLINQPANNIKLAVVHFLIDGLFSDQPMICIECGKDAGKPQRKIMCQSCGQKIDKYLHTNYAYRFIDCIVLRDQVFRHLFLNQELSLYRFLCAIGSQVLPHLFLYYSRLSVTRMSLEADEIDLHLEDPAFQICALILYILLVYIFFRSLSMIMIAFCICSSSFFSLFKIIFVLWKYQKVHFYVALEILNCCSNICALKCFEKDYFKVYATVMVSKIASYTLMMHIFD